MYFAMVKMNFWNRKARMYEYDNQRRLRTICKLQKEEMVPRTAAVCRADVIALQMSGVPASVQGQSGLIFN